MVGTRPDGRWLRAHQQAVSSRPSPDTSGAARAMVAKAEDSRLVTVSLALPDEMTVEVRRPPSGGLAMPAAMDSEAWNAATPSRARVDERARPIPGRRGGRTRVRVGADLRMR